MEAVRRKENEAKKNELKKINAAPGKGKGKGKGRPETA